LFAFRLVPLSEKTWAALTQIQKLFELLHIRKTGLRHDRQLEAETRAQMRAQLAEDPPRRDVEHVARAHRASIDAWTFAAPSTAAAAAAAFREGDVLVESVLPLQSKQIPHTMKCILSIRYKI
jgi:hypothetical protein